MDPAIHQHVWSCQSGNSDCPSFKPPPDTMLLRCPKCPRRLLTPWRRPRRVYERVTKWTAGIARYRCSYCRYEHSFVVEWVRGVTDGQS